MRNSSIFGTHTLLEATDRDANTKLATEKHKIILVIDEHTLATEKHQYILVHIRYLKQLTEANTKASYLQSPATTNEFELVVQQLVVS
jgi:hypothetical protein